MMEDRAVVLGKQLYNLRIEKGLSMQELADMVGVNKSTVFKWEHGQVSLDGASAKHTKELARALGVSPAFLRGEKEMKEPAVDYEIQHGSTVVRMEREKPQTEASDRLLLYALDILAMQNGFRIDYTPDGEVLLVDHAGTRREISEQDLRDVTTDLSSLAGMSFRRLFGGQS